MSSFLLRATHKPTGTVTDYGPWPKDEDPMVPVIQATFHQGFACGWYAYQSPEGSPEDLEFEVLEIPDDVPVGTSEEPTGGNVPVGVTTYASGRVSHPDEASE